MRCAGAMAPKEKVEEKKKKKVAAPGDKPAKDKKAKPDGSREKPPKDVAKDGKPLKISKGASCCSVMQAPGGGGR